MCKCLEQQHGKGVYSAFSSDAVKKAKDMEWDEENNRPVSSEEAACVALVNSNISWITNLAELPGHSTAVTTTRPDTESFNFGDGNSLASVRTSGAKSVKWHVNPHGLAPDEPSTSVPHGDDLSVVSRSSRVSAMRTEIAELKEMIYKLMVPEASSGSVGATGGGGTPPASSGNNHVTPQENETAPGGRAG